MSIFRGPFSWEKLRLAFPTVKKTDLNMKSVLKFGDPYENRTRVTAVKGRCLNRLTKGPHMVAASGLEPPT